MRAGRRRSRAVAAAAWALLAVAGTTLVTGCDDGGEPPGARGVPGNEGGDTPGGPGGPGDDTDGAPGAGDVPEECREPFPLAFGPADLDDIALLPDGFPDPPVPATLCLTDETFDGTQESASYATSASEEEVLAGYEAALADLSPVREQDGAGRPVVTASDGDLFIQVTPRPGGFVLALALSSG
ncbi:hypothetical protein L615_001400000530 [Nocardioides sp. J9]|uniref:hypothetical protein n=1 Tax=Nocardioides sp. J9 TaxID=935844 RepID=UPI0011A815B0|nr:hypothetical protein [Nocardioides sp. J9]TWH01990.1 hypothetical protein L615_001400000530 [Nocardioides sp. J9]